MGDRDSRGGMNSGRDLHQGSSELDTSFNILLAINWKPLMKLDELELLHDVSRLSSKLDVLDRKPNTPQQVFLQNYLHIYLMRHKSPRLTIKAVLEQDKGSFTNLLLRLEYMALCMEIKNEAEYEDFAVLKLLVKWLSVSKGLETADEVNLVESIFGRHLKETFSGQSQELISYLQYIGPEVRKLLNRTRDSVISHTHLDPQDLVAFLNIAVPRVYYNLIIDTHLLGPCYKKVEFEQAQSLYLNQSMLYFARTRKNYRKLIQHTLSIATKMKLSRKDEKTLLEVAMRYLLIYFADAKSDAVELFFTIFESASDVVKFSMSDELLLFVRICNKLQLNLLMERIYQNHQWIKTMFEKIQKNAFLVGHSLKGITPNETFQVMETFNISRGTSEFRSFEIFQQYSVLFLELAVVSHDVNIRLYYLGDFESKIESKKVLNTWEKQSKYLRESMILSKKGLYMLEFDNSYSWVNSKTVMYQKIILTPEGCDVELPSWLKYLYEEINYVLVLPRPPVGANGKKEVKDKKTEKSEQNKPVSKKPSDSQEFHEQTEIQVAGLVIYSKNLFTIKVEQANYTYEFETNLEASALNKLRTLTDRYPNIDWIFDKQATKWIATIEESSQLRSKRKATVDKRQSEKPHEGENDREDEPLLKGPLVHATQSSLAEEETQSEEADTLRVQIPSPSKSLPSSKIQAPNEPGPTGKETVEKKSTSSKEIVVQPFKAFRPRRKLNQQAEKALRDSLKTSS